mmetsp:Transcript_3062/g.8813  ORF Transcript_3062/g.8813 Transcript_3062/m.8813 type:complete len:97 (+) Transcript_3062:188-478(+)
MMMVDLGWHVWEWLQNARCENRIAGMRPVKSVACDWTTRWLPMHRSRGPWRGGRHQRSVLKTQGRAESGRIEQEVKPQRLRPSRCEERVPLLHPDA